MKNLNSIFGLTLEQTQVLFSLQRLITNGDCAYSLANKGGIFSNTSESTRKYNWMKEWDDFITIYLQKLCGKENIHPLYTEADIRELIFEIDSKCETTIWKYLVLLECVLYVPYYPLGEDLDVYKKKYKGLKINKERKRETLIRICGLLSIDLKYIDLFNKAYSKALKSFSGYWTKVALSAGLGMILALIAILTFNYEILVVFAPGLHGAAAISAGLAALGGGAVALGGLGMTGGLVVLIGGGSLLGISAGGAIGLSIASLGADAVLTEAAKMQVVLSEIVLAIQKDTKSFQEIIFDIQRQNQKLKQDLENLKSENVKDKKKIKDLEKSIEYIEKLIKKNL